MSWDTMHQALYCLATTIPVLGSVTLGVGLSYSLRYGRLNRALEEQVKAYKQRYPLTQSIQELELKKGDLEAAVQQLSVQKLELERCKGELAALDEQLRTTRETLASHQTQLAEADRKILEYERMRIHYDALATEIQDLQLQQTTGSQDVRNMQREREALETELRRLSEEFQKLEEKRMELNQLQQQIATLKEEVLETTLRKEKLQAEVEALQASQMKGEANKERALATLKQPAFREFAAASPMQGISEMDFLARFERYLDEVGLYFHPRLLRAFHTAMKCQDISSLVVLAGISGTGKSELPQQYATFANIEKLVVPVQPRWDSPQDLLGFYNYMEHQYKPTTLLRAMRQYQIDAACQDRLLLVLLDEMNLARVEYYFSDFLSKLEARRHHPDEANVVLDFGSLDVSEDERVLQLSSRVLFVGTMNEDESTQTLSDKVLDRSSVLTFPRPESLRLTKTEHDRKPERLPGYLSASTFEAWSRPGNLDPHPVQETVERILHDANRILAGIDRAFGHRVSQGVLRYVLTYPGVLEAYHGGDPTPMWHAISDQLSQKVITKLRGVPLETSNLRVLKALEYEVLHLIQDPLLHHAYRAAYEHEGHAFNWKGLAYEASGSGDQGEAESAELLIRHG